MTILGVDSKCYILALFIRSDGERFLLGSGYYEFKDKQQHFAANTIANDVIEVQGNDGYLLGGQVRRPGVQSFDGYVGDGTTSKTEVEEYRRDFLSFFRKNFTYKVVYVFPDGSAIQRKRGFLVDAPTVQELYQIYPEYHVALNFEDINYYFYDEDASGDEIYGKSAVIGLTLAASGGLVWDALGAVADGYTWTNPVTVSGSEITITNNAGMPAPLESVQLKGDTYQQTYSGKNLFLCPELTNVTGITRTRLGSNSFKAIVNSANANQYTQIPIDGLSPNTTYVVSAVRDVDGLETNAGAIRTLIEGTYGGFQSGDIIFTTGESGNVSLLFYNYSSNSGGANIQNTVTWSNIQIEEGSTATAFEPYVGGIPSPNPDYPQEVQTVTGEQTVGMAGKNIISSPASTIASNFIDSVYNNNMLAEEMTLSFLANITVAGTCSVYIKPTSTGTATKVGDITLVSGSRASLSFALGADLLASLRAASGGVIQIYKTGGNFAEGSITDIQLEQGSTATAYQAYRSQSYTIDLGSIELCKIGDYQDYIYKSGDAWYVHKEVGKVVIDGSAWGGYNATYNWFYTSPAGYGAGEAIKGIIPISNNFTGYELETFRGNKALEGCAIDGASSNPPVIIRNIDYTNATDYRTWLATLKPTVYYALATPTDTQITEQTLIDQLEVLGAAKLFVGQNNILVTATSSNLSATLEASYYTGIDYSGAGYEWEPGEAGGVKIITVDSIDNVYPLLTVTGPTVNPTVTNITTGTIFRYNSTITASQTLKVDMMNKTATLNGTSVIGNVSGDWLYFQPGDNRVDYSTGNADAPNALIEWQEIVG